MEKARRRRINFCGGFVFLPLVLFVCILFYGFPAYATEDQPRVTLDAERISFDDSLGQATAEGNAVLTHGDARIRAERIDYDIASNTARAFPRPGGWVSLESEGRHLLGRSLEYDLNTQEGVMSGVRSSVGVDRGTLFISGGELQSMPYDLAMERGLISHRIRRAPEHVAIGSNVTVTTCIMDRPHYRLVTRNLVVIPGRRMIVRRPRVYLGNTLIFVYPMDYIVRLNRDDSLLSSFLPYIEYNRTRGLGIVSRGGFELGSSLVSIGLGYWNRVGFEWMAAVEQDIGNGGFFVRGGVNYTWNEAWDEHQYSPHVGLFYRRNGWEGALRLAWREYIEDQKDAVNQYRGRLDRRPEFSLYTPWMRDGTINNAQFRLGTTIGRYWERTPTMTSDTVTRYGITLHHRINQPISRNVRFFSNHTYGVWYYNKGGSVQETLLSFSGFNYNFGDLQLMSGYERRRVWRRSPMLWDRYSEAERLHQSIRFPIGRDLFFVTRGSYDMRAEMIDQVNYTIQWITDCMRWELNFRDDRTSGDDSHISLRAVILAFPDAPFEFDFASRHVPGF